MVKIFRPALGFDFNNRIAHVAIPIAEPTKIKNKTTVVNQIYVVSSNKEFWPLTEEEIEKRGLYPDSLPNFILGQSSWSKEYIDRYLEDQSPILNPYLQVFIPIKDTLEKHIEFSHSIHSTLATLWIIGTYIFTIFEAFPYLHPNGTRGSGKSKLLETLYRLCFNAEITSNATPSSIFRIIESNQSTILIDEGELLTGREVNRELQLLLNSGYKKSGTVTRTNTNTFKVEKFQTYSPKAIASINPIDQTLGSRAITVNMIKTGNKKTGNLSVSDKSADWAKIRDSLYRFALDCGFGVWEVFNTSQKIQLLECRNNELWSPLLAIAEYLDSFPSDHNLFAILASLAQESSGSELSIDDWHLAILDALSENCTTNREYQIVSIKLWMLPSFKNDLKEYENISGRWIGNALKRFGFKSGRRTNQGQTYLINPEQVKDLRQRYGLEESSADSELSEEVTSQADPEEQPSTQENFSFLDASPTTPSSQTHPDEILSNEEIDRIAKELSGAEEVRGDE